MQLVVTVVHRDSPRGDDGRVYVLDWDARRVVREFSPPVARIKDFPSRGGGGVRGYRGICFVDDVCYIANGDTLYGYDSNWKQCDVLTHPLFNDIHEIAWDGFTFWVTSTGIDAVLQLDRDATLLDSIFLGELDAPLRLRLGIDAREVDRTMDHRSVLHPMRPEHVAHPNAVQIVDGRPYVTLYRQGAIVALNPFEVIWQDFDFYGSHSGRLAGDTLYLAASFRQGLLAVDLRTNESALISVVDALSTADSRGPFRTGLQEAALWLDARSSVARWAASHAPAWMNPQPQLNRPGWTRGLCVLDPSCVLVGTSPAGLVAIDPQTGEVGDRFSLSESVAHAVFAVEVDPRVPTEIQST